MSSDYTTDNVAATDTELRMSSEPRTIHAKLLTGETVELHHTIHPETWEVLKFAECRIKVGAATYRSIAVPWHAVAYFWDPALTDEQ